MAGILRAYTGWMTRRPALATCTSAAVLFGAGDVLAQQGVERRGIKNHDLMRTARLALYGGCVFSPIAYNWYKMLERIKFTSRPLLVATRVGLDQFALSPMLVAIFYTSMSYLEGFGWEEAEHRISTSWLPTLYANWTLFVPIQLLNFAVIKVPTQRLLIVNVVSLFWNAFLSWKNAQAGDDDETQYPPEALDRKAV